MSGDLVKLIRDDLLKAGMHSELLARKILTDAKWRVTGPRAYLDRDEEKSREIDLSAVMLLQLFHKSRMCIHCEFALVAEIKKSEKPWVVFKRPVDALGGTCAWNNLIAKLYLPCGPSAFVKDLSEYSLLGTNGWEGAGIHESFKNPDQPSRWYGAFISAVKAASDMHGDHPNTEGISIKLTESPTEFFFFQPLVILDGKLFTAELGAGDEMVIEETKSAAFRFENKSDAYNKGPYRVDLVTLEGLAEYVKLAESRHRKITEGIGWATDLILTYEPELRKA